MTRDEFLERSFEFQDTPRYQFLILEVSWNKIHAFEIIEHREKSFKLSMRSMSGIYRGQASFWLPKFCIANSREKNPGYCGILKVNSHMIASLGNDDAYWMKVNLNMIF